MPRSNSRQQKSITKKQIQQQIKQHLDEDDDNQQNLRVIYKHTKNTKSFIVRWEDKTGETHQHSGHYTQQCIDYVIREIQKDLRNS